MSSIIMSAVELRHDESVPDLEGLSADSSPTIPLISKELRRLQNSSGFVNTPPLADKNLSRSSNGSEVSDMTSPPSDSSTILKEKGSQEKRRLSSRVRGKPDLFDASPIVWSGGSSQISSVTAPSPSLSTPSITHDVDFHSERDESDEDVAEEHEVDEDEVVFKKPPPVGRKSKTPLTVTVKKKKKKAVPRLRMPEEEGQAEEESEGDDEDEDEGASLFHIVKNGKSALLTTVDDWIDLYKKNKSSGMVDLIQFFVQSCGCMGKVTRAMVEAEDTVQGIRHLTETFGEQGSEYPLIITKPSYKKFKANFASFILQLISQCQHSIIYDENMMDIMISWIIGLSDSQVRAFRHTSTLAGMKIVSGLIEVALKVGIEMDNTQRQLNTENQKTVNKRSREKLEKLQKKKAELQQNTSDLQEMMSRIFSGIFVHRYRDIRPEIRAVCISEMGHWMKTYSTYFLDQNYLKYLGWTLYDKVGEVRLEVLKALQELYKNEDFIEKLDLFTSRFKDRLVNMALDVDTDVAVLAIKVVSLLHKYDVLDVDDCSQVEQLVFCDNRRLAHAAGEFLALQIIRLSIEASPKKIRKGNREDYMRQMNIKAILDFFIKTELHVHCKYLVDSLWEHPELLKDWKMMTNMLLEKDCLIDLDDQEETALIDLMTSACKMAATGTRPPGREVNKKPGVKEKKALTDDRQIISAHFMEHLPALLDKYRADIPKTTDLITIPQFFELEVYAERRLTKHLEDLLRHMDDIVLKHADTELLEACSRSYHYLIDNEVLIRQTAEVSFSKLLDDIVERFRKSLQSGVPTEQEDKSSQTYFNVVSNLKRLAAFSKDHDLSNWDLNRDVNAIICQGVSASVDNEVLILSLRIMFMFMLKSLVALNPERPNKEDMNLLRKRLRSFVKQLDEFLQFSHIEVKTEAFKILCDLLVFFAKQLVNTSPALAPLVVEADHALQVRMRDYVMAHVFDTLGDDEEPGDQEEEVHAQELYNKRSLLAGLGKLIVFNMFDMKLAAPIFAQFVRAYTDYSDIIKYMMQKTKEFNLIAFTRTLLLALQQVFESFRDDHNGEIDPKDQEFQSIKDLAHKFALMLGVNIMQDNLRRSAIILHREGINYAFAQPLDSTLSPSQQLDLRVPPNLLFLEVLHEFTYRLIKVDRKVVLKHLDVVARESVSKIGPEWMPIRTYRNGLLSKANETKISDEAEKELEEELAVEKLTKNQASNSKSATTAAIDKGAKKKLSMSKVGGSGKWLSKGALNAQETQPPKTAGSIPRIRKASPKKSPKVAAPVEAQHEPDFQITESVPLAEITLKSKKKSRRKKIVIPSPIKKKQPSSQKRKSTDSPEKTPTKRTKVDAVPSTKKSTPVKGKATGRPNKGGAVKSPTSGEQTSVGREASSVKRGSPKKKQTGKAGLSSPVEAASHEGKQSTAVYALKLGVRAPLEAPNVASPEREDGQPDSPDGSQVDSLPDSGQQQRKRSAARMDDDEAHDDDTITPTGSSQKSETKSPESTLQSSKKRKLSYDDSSARSTPSRRTRSRVGKYQLRDSSDVNSDVAGSDITSSEIFSSPESGRTSSSQVQVDTI